MDGTMTGIASKAKELVASNLTSLIESATNPEKMLRLLRSEIEESIIGLQDTLTKANRRYGRLEGEIARLEQSAQDWAAKARLGLEKGRDDLARGALQAREAVLDEIGEAKAALAGLLGESGEAEAGIAQLEAKLSEIRRQIAQFARSAPAAAAGRASGVSARLDRIDELERRVGNAGAREAGAREGGALSEADLTAELRKLEQDARVEAELEKLKAAAAKKKK